MITFKVSEDQYEVLQSDFANSGMRNFSEYIREVLLNSKNKPRKIFTPEILRVMNIIGLQIGRIGNNINQLVKMAHILNNSGKDPSPVFVEFNELMHEYLKTRKELIKAFRRAMKNK